MGKKKQEREILKVNKVRNQAVKCNIFILFGTKFQKAKR